MTSAPSGLSTDPTDVASSARRVAFGVVGRRRSVSWTQRGAKSRSSCSRAQKFGVAARAGSARCVAMRYAGLRIGQPIIDARFGLYLPIAPPSAADLTILALVFSAGLVAGALPAYRAYRHSVADGMVVRT